MFRLFFSICFLVTSFLVTLPSQAKDDYIYRKRIEWVKVTDAASKNLSPAELKHPAQNLNVDQVTEMLSKIYISKRAMFSKKIKERYVFAPSEAKTLARYIVKGLKQADSDQMINFSIIHKRHKLILRNDYITIGNVWVTDQGLHVSLDKLFAKITGDYESRAHMGRAIRNARSIKTQLEIGPGQKKGSRQREIIFDLARFEGLSVDDLKPQTSKANEPQVKENKPQKRASPNADTAKRLKEIKKLRDQKLITEKEYQDLRKKILGQI